MRVLSIGIVVGMVGVMVLGFIGGAFAVEPHESSADTRQRLVLAPAPRDMVLTEMRRMLSSVSGILQGLTGGNLPAAEKAARESGMGGAVDANPHMTTLLPQPFLELGLHTHRGFDTLADQIHAGAAQADIIRDLAKLTGNCVACHAVYRLDEAR